MAQAEEDLEALAESYMAEDPGHEVGTLVAMHNLVTILLLRLEKATGRRPEEELRDIAARYLADPPRRGPPTPHQPHKNSGTGANR